MTYGLFLLFWFGQECFFYQFVLPPPTIEHGAAIIHDGKGDGVAVVAFEVACQGADASVAGEGAGLGRDASYEMWFAETVAQGAVNAGVGQVGEEGLVDVRMLPGVPEKVYQKGRRHTAFRTESATVMQGIAAFGVFVWLQQLPVDELAKELYAALPVVAVGVDAIAQGIEQALGVDIG